jgi:hypothetical protein
MGRMDSLEGAFGAVMHPVSEIDNDKMVSSNPFLRFRIILFPFGV